MLEGSVCLYIRSVYILNLSCIVDREQPRTTNTYQDNSGSLARSLPSDLKGFLLL